MKVTFAPRGILQIDDARIIFRNFSGRGDKFNREGDRNFGLIINGGSVIDMSGREEKVDAQTMADILMNDVNKYDVGWNVKIKPPRNDGDEPFIFMSVKMKFTDKGPAVYLKTGEVLNELDEESVNCLDDVDVQRVDLDIRPYDDEVNGKPFRAAYVQSICVTQEIDRFAARHAVANE